MVQKIFTRDFLFIFLAQLTLSSVYCILIPTFPIYLSKKGSTEVEIGILVGTLSLSSLVFRPFVGRALLRISERTFMVAGALLFALTSMGYFFALTFWPLLTVRIFQGIGAAFFYTAAVTLVAHISPEARLGQSISSYYLGFNIAFALTPTFGMFLIDSFGFNVLFAVCTGLSLCSLFVMTRLKERHVHPSDPSPPEESPILSRKALPPAIVAFLSAMTWGALSAFFPLYALDHGMANPGLFFTVYAMMIILGRVLGGRVLDIYPRESVLLPCLAAGIIAMGILPFSKSLFMFLVVAAICGIGHAFLYPALVAYTLGLTRPSRGPAIGTYSAFEDFGTGIGPVIIGIILRFTSYPIMFVCLVLAGIINLNYFYFFIKKKAT